MWKKHYVRRFGIEHGPWVGAHDLEEGVYMYHSGSDQYLVHVLGRLCHGSDGWDFPISIIYHDSRCLTDVPTVHKIYSEFQSFRKVHLRAPWSTIQACLSAQNYTGTR